MRMSEFSNIDQLFESHFAEHEVMVRDKDNLWKRIRPQRKYRLFFLLFLIGAISVTGLYFTFFTEVSNSDDLVNAVGAIQNPVTLSRNQLHTENAAIENTAPTPNAQDPKHYTAQVIQLHRVSPISN